MPRRSVPSRPPRRSLDHGGRSVQRNETHRRHATTDDSRRASHGESSRNNNTERKLRRTAPGFLATPPLTPESSDLVAPREVPHQEPLASSHSQPRFDTPADDDNVDMSPPAAEESPPLNDPVPAAVTYAPEPARSIDGDMNRQNHGEKTSLPTITPMDSSCFLPRSLICRIRYLGYDHGRERTTCVSRG